MALLASVLFVLQGGPGRGAVTSSGCSWALLTKGPSPGSAASQLLCLPRVRPQDRASGLPSPAVGFRGTGLAAERTGEGLYYQFRPLCSWNRPKDAAVQRDACVLFLVDV